MASSINDIDAQIAKLEAELSDGSSDDSHSSSSSHSGSDEDRSDSEIEEEGSLSPATAVEKSDGLKLQQTGGVLATVLADEDRIVPLPSHCLPAIAVTSTVSKRRGQKRSSSDQEGCGKKTRQRVPSTFTTHSAPQESRKKRKDAGGRGEAHRPQHQERVKSKEDKQKELMEYIHGYVPSERRPFACRLCQFQGESEADLLRHRRTPDHLAAVEREKKACFCKLCRKNFTSPAQLTEHLKGTAHAETLQRRRSSQQQEKRLRTQETQDPPRKISAPKKAKHGKEHGKGKGRGVALPADRWKGDRGRGAR